MEYRANKNVKKLKFIEKDESQIIAIDPDRTMKVSYDHDGVGLLVEHNSCPIQTRDEGEFMGKAFYLNNTFDWEFGYDSFGLIVLVPLKKKDVDHG
jgi:hypothetical protein